MAGGRDEQRVTTWDHDEDTSSVLVHGDKGMSSHGSSGPALLNPSHPHSGATSEGSVPYGRGPSQQGPGLEEVTPPSG